MTIAQLTFPLKYAPNALRPQRDGVRVCYAVGRRQAERILPLVL